MLAVLNKYRAAKGDIIHVIHEGSEESPVMTKNTDLEKVFPELTPIDGEHVSPPRLLFSTREITRVFLTLKRVGGVEDETQRLCSD